MGYDPAVGANLIGPLGADNIVELRETSRTVLRTSVLYRLRTDTDDPPVGSVTRVDLLKHAELPKLGDAHPQHGIVTHRDLRYRGRRNWDVVIEYEQTADKPLVFHGADFVSRTEQVQRVESGAAYAPLINSAGEPFVPPPTREAGTLRLKFTRKFSEDISGSLHLFLKHFAQAHYSVNSTLWPAAAPVFKKRSLLCVIEALNYGFFSEGTPPQPRVLWVIDFAVLVSPTHEYTVGNDVDNFFDLQLLDHGHWYKDQDGNQVRFMDASGRPITGNLDGNGGPLGASDPPVFLTFPKYREFDWITAFKLDDAEAADFRKYMTITP